MSAKGSVRLAAMLQKRMGKVKNFDYSPSAELGKIKGNGLVLDSFPKEVIAEDDYMILSIGNGAMAADTIEAKDRVLVVWAEDMPVVIGKVQRADKNESRR